MRLSFTLSASILLLLATSGAARADDPEPPFTVHLEYTLGPGAERCPGEKALRDAVVGGLGYDPFRPVAPSRMLTSITRQNQAYSVAMKRVDTAGKFMWGDNFTTSPGEKCITVIDAMATSMTIGFLSILPPPRPKAEPTPEATPAPKAEPPKPEPAPKLSPPVAAPKPSRLFHVRLDAGTSLSAGSAPTVAGSFSGQVGIGWPFVSIALEARDEIQTAVNEQIVTSALSGALVPCLHPRRIGLVCALGVLGSRRFSDRAETTSGDNLFAGAGLRGGVEIPVVGPFALRGTVDLLGSILRVTARVRATETWTSPWVSGALGVGVVASL